MKWYFNTPKAEALSCYKAYAKVENEDSCPLSIKLVWF